MIEERSWREALVSVARTLARAERFEEFRDQARAIEHEALALNSAPGRLLEGHWTLLILSFFANLRVVPSTRLATMLERRTMLECVQQPCSNPSSTEPNTAGLRIASKGRSRFI
jgi:hypothetical protein